MKLFIVLATVLLMGCASLAEQFITYEAPLERAVTIGTAKYIEKSTNPVRRAERVNELAIRGINFTETGVIVPVTEFTNLIKREIGYAEMLPSDQLIIDDVVRFIENEFSDSDVVEMEEARTIFVWIKNISERYL